MMYLACFPEKEFFKWLTIPEYMREGVYTTHLQTGVFYNFKSIKVLRNFVSVKYY